MKYTKKEALANIEYNCGNNATIAVQIIIDCLYRYGIKDSYYKDFDGTVYNVLQNLSSADSGSVNNLNLAYLRGVVENAIDWNEED